MMWRLSSDYRYFLLLNVIFLFSRLSNKVTETARERLERRENWNVVILNSSLRRLEERKLERAWVVVRR